MSTLIIEAEKFVFNLLSNELDTKYVYHNLAHTQRVVEKTEELSENLKITKVDAENLKEVKEKGTLTAFISFPLNGSGNKGSNNKLICSLYFSNKV